MRTFFTVTGRCGVLLVILTASLSAQRYSGHDHAVFHRAPPPPATAKRQSGNSQNNLKPGPKTSVPAAPQSSSPRASPDSMAKPSVETAHSAVVESKPQF